MHEVVDDDVGTAFAEDLWVLAPRHPDHQAEAPGPARSDPRDRVFHHDGTLGRRPEHPGCMFERIGSGLAAELLLRGDIAVYPGVEEVHDARRFSHRPAVPAGGYNRHAGSPAFEPPDHGNRRFEHLDASNQEYLLEGSVLAVTEATDRLCARGIVRFSPREYDAARAEEGVNPIVARPAVNVFVVVGIYLERHEAGPSTLRNLFEVPVERAFPRRGVHAGRVGDDTVQIEQPGVVCADKDGMLLSPRAHQNLPIREQRDTEAACHCSVVYARRFTSIRQDYVNLSTRASGRTR